MDGINVLAGHLQSLSPEELADVMEARPELLGWGRPRNLATAARSLFAPGMTMGLVYDLPLPELRLLRTAVSVARDDPDARLRARSPYDSITYNPLSSYVGYVGDTARGFVEADLMASTGAQSEASRATVARMLTRLNRSLLVWPGESGRWFLAPGLNALVGVDLARPRLLDEALTERYGFAELRVIAEALGLSGQGKRAEVQHRITAHLGDPAALRAVLAEAPEKARAMLGNLVEAGALLGTHCFDQPNPRSDRYVFREGGSGDPSTDWLARRGLLLPVAPERAGVCVEVFHAVLGDTLAVIEPEPPVLTEVPLPEHTLATEAQAALSAAAATAERLLRELAERPAAIRKSGGITVRDLRRLAKAIDRDTERAALWVELAAATGLAAVDGTQATSRLLPTANYDGWLELPPARRLAPWLSAWAHLPNVASWLAEDEHPVLPMPYQDPSAPALRSGLLRALASLPPGHGTGLRPRAFLAADALPDPAVSAEARTFFDTVAAAVWHRPLAYESEMAPGLFLFSWLEAEELGVAAHGALTEAGRALLEDGSGKADLADALADLLPAPETRARFQADMTAIVTGAPALDLERLLDAVADRESEGGAGTWRFSAASVRRALDAGRDADFLVAELARVSVGALPQPLEYLVRDTARGHGRVRVVRAACCLRSDDPALLRELAGARSLRTLGLRAIAPTVLVSTRPEKEVLEALRAQGYAPAVEAATGITVVERPKQHRAAAPKNSETARTRQDLLAAARVLLGEEPQG